MAQFLERYLKEKKRSSITEIVLNCIKMISSHINPSQRLEVISISSLNTFKMLFLTIYNKLSLFTAFCICIV